MVDPLHQLSETEQKIKQVTRLMEKIDIEYYYNVNFRVVLARQSYPFLADLETFLDQCMQERGEVDFRLWLDDNLGKLESYLITFTNGSMMHFSAVDEEHAREQARNAEPDLEIETVKHEWS